MYVLTVDGGRLEKGKEDRKKERCQQDGMIGNQGNRWVSATDQRVHCFWLWSSSLSLMCSVPITCNWCVMEYPSWSNHASLSRFFFFSGTLHCTCICYQTLSASIVNLIQYFFTQIRKLLSSCILWPNLSTTAACSALKLQREGIEKEKAINASRLSSNWRIGPARTVLINL